MDLCNVMKDFNFNFSSLYCSSFINILVAQFCTMKMDCTTGGALFWNWNSYMVFDFFVKLPPIGCNSTEVGWWCYFSKSKLLFKASSSSWAGEYEYVSGPGLRSINVSYSKEWKKLKVCLNPNSANENFESSHDWPFGARTYVSIIPKQMSSLPE